MSTIKFEEDRARVARLRRQWDMDRRPEEFFLIQTICLITPTLIALIGSLVAIELAFSL